MAKPPSSYTPSEDLITIVTTVGRASAFNTFIQKEHLPYDEIGRELNIFADDVENGLRQYRERAEISSVGTPFDNVSTPGSETLEGINGEANGPIPTSSKTEC